MEHQNSAQGSHNGPIAAYDISRKKAAFIAVLVGVLLGVGNLYLDLDFRLRLELMIALVGSVVIVIVVHEGVHGAVALALGHKPRFGVKLPLVYMTMDTRVPRGHFIAIALAPLIVLDIAFGLLYWSEHWKLFANFCFSMNTLGATGDIWISWRALTHARGTYIQDTKTGIEVWAEPSAPTPPTE